MQFVSEGCFELTGFRPEELIEDKVISYANLIHKEDRLLVNDDVQKALEKKNRLHCSIVLSLLIMKLNGFGKKAEEFMMNPVN